MKNDSKEYRYYVVFDDGMIESGWEYMDDAQDRVSELLEVESCRVRRRVRLEQSGVDLSDDLMWRNPVKRGTDFEFESVPGLPGKSLRAETLSEAEKVVEETLRIDLFDNALVRENAAKFGKAVDVYHTENRFPRRAMFPFTHCPEVFIELWGEKEELFMPKTVLDKLERMPDGKTQGHNIPLPIIKQLPVAIHDPVMVFSSATDVKGTTLVAVLDLKSPEPFTGRTQNICCAVEFDVGGHVEIIGLVKSAYGKSDEKYKRWIIQDKTLLYADIKRTGKWLSTAGLQLSGGKPFPGSKHIILTKEEFVKSRVEKIMRNLEKKFQREEGLGAGL